MLELSSSETASWVAQLERPEEVACLLKVRANGVNLVNEVLHANNTVLAEVGFDQSIVGEGDALFFDLAITALVDEFADGLQIRVSIGNVRLDDFQHLAGGFGKANEDAVVDLQKTE